MASVVTVTDDLPRGYEIRIAGCADTAAALALQEPLARLLCPVEDHPGPCPLPWSFSLGDDDAGRPVLVLLVWTTGGTAAHTVRRVQTRIGPQYHVTLAAGAGEMFDGVAQQYRIEHGGR